MLSYNECYHGTSYENYLSISKTKQFKCKHRKNHWLGQGAYFFLEDIEKAKWFVKVSRSPELKAKKKCVLQISVNIETDKLLNLDIESGRKKLSEFAQELEKEGVEIKSRESFISNSELRCYLIDLYGSYFNIQAVKYTFTDDKISYVDFNTNVESCDKIQNNGIQLNIIDQSIINFNNLKVQCI